MFPFLSLLSAGFWKQHRDVSSPIENVMSKNSLYSRTTNYIEGESPHLPKELDHSLGIAREEVPHNFFTRWGLNAVLCQLIVPHLTVLMVLSPRSDCVQGERSAGVEEKVRGQPTGSGGDEVRGRAGVYECLPVFLLNGKVSQCFASCLQAPPIITF